MTDLISEMSRRMAESGEVDVSAGDMDTDRAREFCWQRKNVSCYFDKHARKYIFTSAGINWVYGYKRYLVIFDAPLPTDRKESPAAQGAQEGGK